MHRTPDHLAARSDGAIAPDSPAGQVQLASPLVGVRYPVCSGGHLEPPQRVENAIRRALPPVGCKRRNSLAKMNRIWEAWLERVHDWSDDQHGEHQCLRWLVIKRRLTSLRAHIPLPWATPLRLPEGPRESRLSGNGRARGAGPGQEAPGRLRVCSRSAAPGGRRGSNSLLRWSHAPAVARAQTARAAPGTCTVCARYARCMHASRMVHI